MKKPGKVYFIGAGPGDPELLTLKAKRIIEKADLLIYAGSLVNPEILAHKKKKAVSYNSASMDLKEIVSLISREVKKGNTAARIHSGDPAIYGAIREQIALLEKKGIACEVIPGVSSVFAAAATLRKELTVPELSQTIILTRISGRTKVPSRESIPRLARSQSTMAIFLSITQIEKIVEQLLTSYPPETPAAVVYRASWPDEKVIKGTLATIAGKVQRAAIKKQALILVGRALGGSIGGLRSQLYHEGFTHGCRQGQREKKDNLAIVALTKSGAKLGTLIKERLPRAYLHVPGKLGIKGTRVKGFTQDFGDLCGELVQHYSGIICIMAAGIVVRTVSPFLCHKSVDPAIVVVDEKGRRAISLVSGHLGGANDLAREVASITGGEPVITTATDVHETLALDLLAKQLNCTINDFDILKKCNYGLLHGKKVGIYPDSLKSLFSPGKKGGVTFYKSIGNLRKSACAYKVIVSNKQIEDGSSKQKGTTVILNPKNLVVGIGCNRNTTAAEIEDTVKRFFKKWGLSFSSIKKVATVDLKASEKGLTSFARRHRFEIEFFTPAQLNRIACPSPPSRGALKAIGSKGVCEPAAMLGAGVKTLLCPKRKTSNVTVAVAEIPLKTVVKG
jgi:precorrin-4 C11-methyltransferase